MGDVRYVVTVLDGAIDELIAASTFRCDLRQRLRVVLDRLQSTLELVGSRRPLLALLLLAGSDMAGALVYQGPRSQPMFGSKVKIFFYCVPLACSIDRVPCH